MISPVAQRQIFQTANVEATRLAHEVSGQIQREAVSRQAAEDRLTEGSAEVHQISHSDRIRTEERKQQRQQASGGGPHGEEPEEGADAEASGKAGPAGPHLDLLA